MDFYPDKVEYDGVVYKRAKMMRPDKELPQARDYIGKYIYLLGAQSADSQRHMVKVDSVDERGMYITLIFDEPIIIGDTNRLRIVSWYEPNGVLPIAYETILESTIRKKALNQRVRNVYEFGTGHAADPGSGPANLIRAYLDARSPRGAEGASSRHTYKIPPRQPGPSERRLLKQKVRGMGPALESLQENYFRGGKKRTKRVRKTRRRR